MVGNHHGGADQEGQWRVDDAERGGGAQSAEEADVHQWLGDPGMDQGQHVAVAVGDQTPGSAGRAVDGRRPGRSVWVVGPWCRADPGG
jgi:hypothetical protein